MPIQSPPWTDFMLCPVCAHEFAAKIRAPITLGCGHSICKNCLTTLHRKQCPYDQTDIQKNFDNLPINYALLQLTTTNIDSLEREVPPSTVKALSPSELKYYERALKCIEELALLLKPNGNISGLLSRPMQRKLVTLVQCQLLETEGRARSLRAVRSLGERTVTELILQHQNPHQLSTNLWAAVRSRGCQFLGPAMQEEVLKLVLLALEDGSPLSRKILVMYVVQKLEATFPQASKTSIGHVVQLLYRASCFKVSKREGDSSLMTLKEEFRTYDALRREHDTQIVQIATEAGLRIAPDQWSALLYGDSNHKSHMQSIIDKQQSPSSFAQSVDELMLALQRTGDPVNLAKLRNDLENLSKIDPSLDLNLNTSWSECADSLRAVREVVFGLFDFVHHHGKSKIQESYNQNASRYKVSLCRELQTRGTCARGQNCSFAHSDEELERYRAKYKKNSMRTIIQNNQMKDSNVSASNGPIPKINTAAINNHHSNYPKCPAPYRSENSLHHSSATVHQQQTPHNNLNHHLRPSNAYNSTTGSSSSTPNLTQMQLSPNPTPPITKSISPQINSRFPFNQRSNVDSSKGMQFNTVNYAPLQHYNNQRPPLSAPPIASYNNNKKPISPYHNAMISNRNLQQQPARLHHGMDNGNGYYQSQNQITSSSPQMYRNNKYHPWQQQQQPRSPNNIHSQASKSSKSNSASSSAIDNRVPVDLLFQQHCNIDELDGISMWKTPQMTTHASAYLFPNSSGSSVSNKDKFIRSDSILASSTNDETFDNMTVTGKYGAIGGLNKSPDASQQWSGLQLTMNNRFESPGSSNNNNNNNLGGNILKIDDVLSKNGDHSTSQTVRHHHYGGINGNFLNINHQLTSKTDNDYWSMKDSSSTKDLDIGALGNGISVLNLLDLINE